MNPASLDERLHLQKILIIDDEEQAINVLADILRDEHYPSVETLKDSRRAPELFQDYRPDLILLDLNMPHKNGFQLMEEFRQADPDWNPPILVITGETESELRIRALRSGARDFISKPFDIPEVLARIKNLLEMHLMQKDLRDQNSILDARVSDRTRQLREALAGLNASHHQIKQAYIETIYRLTLACEYKDEDTTAHIRRMSLYCRILAEKLNMNQGDIDLLFYSSPMHDIGKIGIPDRILLKKGPLPPEDWEVMKTHTIIGAKILSGSEAPILKLGEKIALNHHERWDGSGYPNGLKGEAIPVEARIVMLTDIYDALRSKRPYKEAFDHKTACRIILEGDDRVQPGHFDPCLLEIFKSVDTRFEKTFDENPGE